ncbi:hypothetical protein [Enterobacter phage 01_vB_Eclo_IJM]|nr:hypothetical protein [Enterobacter phage 01_vB_Eclo_IJM]
MALSSLWAITLDHSLWTLGLLLSPPWPFTSIKRYFAVAM